MGVGFQMRPDAYDDDDDDHTNNNLLLYIILIFVSNLPQGYMPYNELHAYAFKSTHMRRKIHGWMDFLVEKK